MAGLKHIKGKIQAMKKSQTVTKAMEAVSAAKMRKAQMSALSGRSYARAAADVLSRVGGSRELAGHPLANIRSVNKALYIVITSDKGLAGALNSGVLRAAAANIRESGLAPENTQIIAVGRKAHDFFAARGYTIRTYYQNNADISHAQMRGIVTEAAALFADGEVDIVRIAYQNFISTFEQRPTLRTVFPLSLDELKKVVGDIAPSRGAFAEQGKLIEKDEPKGYALEPSEGQVLDAVVPILASVIVHHALLESQASEHSARMVAMKSASDKAAELEHALTLQFNKARQAAITREVSEITGGMEAMAN